MYSQVYYLLRSKQDGRHLAARTGEEGAAQTFLLLFGADHEALTYLSTHAPEARDRFALESVSAYQLKDLLKRWGFRGVGLVRDPVTPMVDFLEQGQALFL
ncbi:hypothetical protein [Leptolyngbya sp. PCC 6406]|uniref:hypothetical protein n=1 Tax=Leptolyngbya sp. PCC 6406 TaxID=1173264 RepID=UPI0002ACA204|nr:hypothetical protein [Leptolyngbya sp. PCC 6406]